MPEFSPSQIFIVTGASSGIGKAIAFHLNNNGASVIAIARRLELLEELKKGCKFPQHFHIISKDLTENIDELPAFVKSLREQYGRLTGLVCAAGTDNVIPLGLINTQAIDNIFKINYQTPIMLAKGFADRRNHMQEKASLLFISSIASDKPAKGQCLYAASKAALNASLQVMAKELAAQKIRCNSILPGPIDTDLLRQNPNFQQELEKCPLGVGTPQDIARLAAFLLSDAAGWITGQKYIIDGGYCA